MLKIIFPILVLCGAVFLGKFLLATGPEAEKKPFTQRLPIVEVSDLKAQPYTVYIEASGVVTAGTQSNLVAEVSGRIVDISKNFSEGSYFEKGEVLLEIDKLNYISAVEIAKSDVEVNKANLKELAAEEKSNLRSIELAKKNLNIGNKELARLKGLFNRNTISRSALDTEEQRINQLEQSLQSLQGSQSTFSSRKSAIQARINASEAMLKQEKLTLSRTSIKAPYAGRILIKNVDIGQYVSTGTTLAEIYATDFVNVELPLSLNQYELLGIPESFINKEISKDDLPEVSLMNPDSLRDDTWQGKVVRTSAALDAQSRQINVIVQVDDPYEAREGISLPIRIGQFLNAQVKGRTFENVYVLPPVSVKYNREIRLLSDGRVKIVPIKVVWNSSDSTVVQTDENIDGQELILTSLPQAVNGMSVITVAEQKKKNKERSGRQRNKEKQKERGDKQRNREERGNNQRNKEKQEEAKESAALEERKKNVRVPSLVSRKEEQGNEKSSQTSTKKDQ